MPNPAEKLDQVPTDARQAADREALLEELADVEHQLDTLSRYREQLHERLGERTNAG